MAMLRSIKISYWAAFLPRVAFRYSRPAQPMQPAIEEHDAGIDEITSVAPAAINDQVRQSVITAGGLAVHLKTGLGLGCCGGSSALLEAGAFGAGGQAGHVSLGDGSEAEHQEGRAGRRRDDASERFLFVSCPLTGQDVTCGQ